jgi:hypothetical protein
MHVTTCLPDSHMEWCVRSHGCWEYVAATSTKPGKTTVYHQRDPRKDLLVLLQKCNKQLIEDQLPVPVSGQGQPQSTAQAPPATQLLGINYNYNYNQLQQMQLSTDAFTSLSHARIDMHTRRTRAGACWASKAGSNAVIWSMNHSSTCTATPPLHGCHQRAPYAAEFNRNNIPFPERDVHNSSCT